MISTSDIREEYINRFSDLQYKHRNDKEKEVIIILLAIMFTEKFTNQNNQSLLFYAPFIEKIADIDKPQHVIRNIEEALNGRGRLAEPLKEFRQVHRKMITAYVNIIPQKEPEIHEKRIKDLYERTEHTAVSNAISLSVNKAMFNKSFKTWNTQRDGKVRKTTFHGNVDRKTVMIDDFFEVDDMKAQFPADTSLPEWERLNCRCYLIYH